MTCRDLERWLDDGGAPERYVEAMAHARICAHCSAALGNLDELETLLAAPSAPTPAGFTARVMARVALTPQVRARIPVTELLPFFQTVPWWVRLALEPASLLSAVILIRSTARRLAAALLAGVAILSGCGDGAGDAPDEGATTKDSKGSLGLPTEPGSRSEGPFRPRGF